MRSREWASEALPGLAAMLVAVPAALANGLVMYAPLGAASTAAGAMAGLLGAVALGVIAPLLGGTPRLVSAPSPAAAAFMAVLAADLLRGGVAPARVPTVFAAVILVAGTVQVAVGAVRAGRLVKFMPYPVIAGYLTGAGLLILFLQLPRLVGAPAGTTAWRALREPSGWSGVAIAIAAATIAVTLLAPRLTRRIPATLVGLAAGVAVYRVAAVFRPELLHLHGAGPLVVGPLAGAGALDGLAAAREGLTRVLGIGLGDLRLAVVPGLMLGVLVSIDTLKTCLLVDVLTHGRHDSDRELVGQGLGNAASALVGGAPGTGIVSASVVNVAGGARGRASAVLAGLLALAVLLALGPLVAWLPVPALAAIVCLMAARMFQREALVLLRERQTLLEFVVVAAVIGVAMAFNLAAAAAAGVAVSLVLFVREQARAPLVRRLGHGDGFFSKHRRGAREREVLVQHGAETVIAEVQGSLFFGSADRLYRTLEPHLARCRRVVLDLSRVGSVDVTAATMLRQVAARLGERGARLALADLPGGRTGELLRVYISRLGLDRPPTEVLVFPHLEEALEWAEDEILARELSPRGPEAPLPLAEMELCRGLPEPALRALEAVVEERAVARGEELFPAGSVDSELYLVRAGKVRIVMPLEGGKGDVLATVGRGELLGEMGFTDREPRSATAIAAEPTLLHVLSREGLARAARRHPEVELLVLARLAHVLAARLRIADVDRKALREL